MSTLTPYHCSVHSHSTFCDGKNTPAEMAAAACAAGVKYYGFSGHGHTPVPQENGVVMSADMTAYRTEVLRLREEYAGRMEVLLGIEMDRWSDVSTEGFDYWIGSVHSLYDPDTGKYHSIDWTLDMITECVDEMFRGDGLAMAEEYYRQVSAVAAKKPHILGHVDIVTKLNEDGRFFDETSLRYRAAALDALHMADPIATVLEINTGAIARGYRKIPYPAQFLLEEWRRMGGEIILTADTHAAETILFGYELAAELARAAGYDHAQLLTGSGWQECGL